MSWSPATDMITSIGLTPGSAVPILLRASRSEETACLTIGQSGCDCEIRLNRAHVEALRDQLPDVLAALDRVAAEDAACGAAEAAGRQAADAAAIALDQAVAAEAVGATEVAATARAAAAEAAAAAADVGLKVQAMADAATGADGAADRAVYAANRAAEAVRRAS